MPYKAGRALPWSTLGGGLFGVMAILALLAHLVGSARTAPPTCPPTCKPPQPVSRALTTTYHYVSSAYGYSLDYLQLTSSEGADPLLPSKNDDRSVGWQFPKLDSIVTFSAEPAEGRGPEQVVDDSQQRQFPDAVRLYSIPQAEVGYVPGYGVVYQWFVRTAGGQNQERRIILMAAIRQNLVVKVEGAGRYELLKNGHPNPANTRIAGLLGNIANTVVWPGDPPL